MARAFHPRRWRPVGWLLLLIPLGCSFSDSSKSSWDSSASSSRSSSPGDTACFDDVRSTTAAYAKSGSLTLDALRARVAASYGMGPSSSRIASPRLPNSVVFD